MSVKILTELKLYPFVDTDFVVVDDDAEEVVGLRIWETKRITLVYDRGTCNVVN